MFAVECIDLLGHCTSAEGRSPWKEKVSVERDLPCPKNTQSLINALGLFNYCGEFVGGFWALKEAL